MHLKWLFVVLFFGVSTISFVTQSIFAIKDFVFGSKVQGINTVPHTKYSDNQVLADSQKVNNIKDIQDQEPRGADDAKENTLTDQYRLLGKIQIQRPTARAYLAADVETGEVIVEHNDSYVAPMASVSKLMTAVIAHEQMDMQKYAIVSRDSYNTYGTQGELSLGEKIRVQDLMYPLLTESSNDAAEVLADAYDKGHAAFLLEMNKKAAELGMTDTYFEDPSGLDPKNVSTVRDLMILGRYIYKKDPIIYDITRVKQYSIRKHTWVNKNRFLTYDSFLGGKNGYIDESKKTTVSLFDITLAKGGKRTVMIVLLKSDDREGDALKIINYLKKDVVFEVD